MSLQTQIKEDMKNAMRAKESAKLMTLRGILGAFTDKLLSLGKMPQDTLEDTEALSVIKSQAKRRKDSIAQYAAAGRDDLVATEQVELGVLEVYLPEMMAYEAVLEIVKAKKEELGVVDKTGVGQLMGALMGDLKDKADGADVKKAVDEVLS